MSTQPDVSACRQVLERLSKLPVSGDAHRVAQHCLVEYLTTGSTEFRMGVGDLASKLGLHRNTVGKALSALTDGGILRRSGWRGRGGASMTLALVLDPAQEHEAKTKYPLPTRRNNASPAVPRHLPSTGDYERALGRAGEWLDAVLLSTYHAAGNPSAWVPRQEWGLSEDDIGIIRSVIPDRSRDPIEAHPTPSSSPMNRSEPVPTQLSFALREAAPELRVFTHGDGDAVARYLREIAYSVLHGGLGRGNADVGVKQAIRIVRQGRWGTPFGMPESWNPDLSAIEVA